MIKLAVSIGCIEFLLNRRADGQDFMGKFFAGLGYNCFSVRRAGGVQDLVRPSLASFRDSILRDVRVGIEHGAEIVLAANHEKCRAYDHFEFKSREIELLRHQSDLLLAQEIIANEFSGIITDIYFAESLPGTEDTFVIKPLPI